MKKTEKDALDAKVLQRIKANGSISHTKICLAICGSGGYTGRQVGASLARLECAGIIRVQSQSKPIPVFEAVPQE